MYTVIPGEVAVSVVNLRARSVNDGAMSVSFFSLPPHDVVYTLILPCLSTVEVCNLSLVCRRFQEMCEDYFRTFCRTLHYSEQGGPRGQVDRNRSYILYALRKCRKMERFYLSLKAQKPSPQLAQSYNSLLFTLSYTHSQLTSLSLQNLNCTDAMVSCFERLGKQCWKLQELHLEAVPYFNDDCFVALTNECCYIVVLTLKTLPKFKGINLERLAERCCMLKHLNVNNIFGVVMECCSIKD